MKYKNYKSAIHNFTHSFISIDFMVSGRLSANVLIDLYNLKKKSESTFNFIKNTITPKEAVTVESRQLLDDYLSWLPEHFKRHNCDILKLQKFDVTIWIDFDNAITPARMRNTVEFTINALTKWKAYGREELFKIENPRNKITSYQTLPIIPTLNISDEKQMTTTLKVDFRFTVFLANPPFKLPRILVHLYKTRAHVKSRSLGCWALR